MKQYRFLKRILSTSALLAIVISSVTNAQETTSAIRGHISGPNGNSVKNAQIVITHQPSNRQTKIQSNESGRFMARGLRVGGPYSITITSKKGERKIEDVYLNLGDTLSLNLQVGNATIEEVTVVGKEIVRNVALGPSSSFDLTDLQNAPTVDRDIKDLLRTDPRIYIDEANANEVHCGGANPRFNSLTVDGIKMNDNFGLNGNGYPTERMPFSYDAIDQIAVELAPFDVQYGGFSACNINAVTKSGTNEFHGSVFVDYTDDSFNGDSLEGESIDIGTFDEKRYGFTVGGPIIKDKLFFFVSYEELDGVQTFSRGTADSNAAVKVQGVTQDQINLIRQIANDTYNYQVGSFPSTLPIEDEKLLIKLDWAINDYHRASFTYNYNDGYSIGEADGDADELEFSDHYYERGAELNSYVGHLFSDWTENFSTELKLGYSELDNRQISLNGSDFGEVRINTSNDHDNDGNPSSATVYLGADDSRHANQLSYETYNFKFTATYRLNNHTLYAGFEREEYDVANLFIQEAEGEYTFSSIEDFAAGTPSSIVYENAAGSNNPGDATAEFGYEINTFYIQDEYVFESADISMVVGLRYDRYTSDDKPTYNETIDNIYNRSNQQNVDGLDLLQPRMGINWDVNENLELHGGIGLYSGGNPNVWISNNYANNGVTQVEARDRSGNSILDPNYGFTGLGRPIYDIPQTLYDDVASGSGNTGVNLQDKDFKIPSAWKYAIGASLEFGDGYLFSTDFLYTKNKDAAIIQDISRVQIDTAIDGRPIYDSIAGRRQDFLLTNVSGDSGSSTVFSMGISKSFESGLDVQFGYAYTQAEDVNPMTSSVAYSNYTTLATDNPNNPDVATSNYEIPHRFTLRLYYEKAFIGNFKTKFSLIGSANEGRPYSYAFSDNTIFGEFVFTDRQLLYVPTGITDPNVIFGDGFDAEAFFAFVDDENLDRGRIMKRNELNSDWWTKFDVRVEQEFPGFSQEHSASAFFVIENLGNLINDDWGVLYETDFPRIQSAVNATIDEDSGRYVFNSFEDPATQTRVRDASLWKARIGIRYDF